MSGGRARWGAAVRVGWQDERGSSPGIELIAALPIVILVGLAVWQLLLVGYTATVAQEAARTGARAAAAEQDGAGAARAALPAGMRSGATVSASCGGGEVPGCEVEVTARVPIVLQRLSSGSVALTRSAVLPGRAD